MAKWTALLPLLLLLTLRDVLLQEECPKRVVTSCKDCINSGPRCAWCKTLNFTKKGEPDAVRCDTVTLLMSRGCEETNIISPMGRFEVLRDVPLSKAKSAKGEPVQLKPQEVRLFLRPSLPRTFQLRFKRAEDYPVDLYYLMDLSYSMKDDLENVKSLGKDLLKALRSITSQARIGFGSFVDKVALPFTDTNPKKIQKPCPEIESQCQPAFGYKHVLSMTANDRDFNNRVSSQFISGNLDSPEGGLDALMQAAVCGEKIGWGNSTRLLVFATDDGFHMAGDGKLGAILEPNDGLCHLDRGLLYSKSSEMDYPSVGQVALKLQENNIQPIFAVTKNVEPVYRKLKEVIPKSEVGVLTTNSDNVVTLIANAYKNLSSNVIVTHEDLREGITVTYTSNCAGGARQSTRGTCDNVGIGDEVVFNVTVTAQRCLPESSFLIGPLGFREKIKVSVATQCECECDDPLGKTSKQCSGAGSITCGTCNCTKGFVGQHCECKVDGHEERLRDACRRDNSTICSGRGDCVCGVCQCHAGEDGRAIYGTFCECDDRSCEVHQNLICGGNGKCDCGKCICNSGYEGSACQCPKDDEGCQKGNSVCSGRGKCVCNVCQCLPGYNPPFCEECPGCVPLCNRIGNCIECLGFDTGAFSKNCTQACKHVTHSMVEDLSSKQVCKWRDTENCWILYLAKQLDGVEMYEAAIHRQRECPEPPNILAIIGGAFGGVALIGLLLILIIKALIYMKDLKEFRRFENEKKKAKWSNADNPLFKTATTTVQNPNFSGD